ncbi:hypothetical protein F5146DRAFT_1007015 [Armillaria mellea]|nr:hypothetical protein F5146DRAFT_1007015 [Armillaria mellea]
MLKGRPNLREQQQHEIEENVQHLIAMRVMLVAIVRPAFSRTFLWQRYLKLKAFSESQQNYQVFQSSEIFLLAEEAGSLCKAMCKKEIEAKAKEVVSSVEAGTGKLEKCLRWSGSHTEPRSAKENQPAVAFVRKQQISDPKYVKGVPGPSASRAMVNSSQDDKNDVDKSHQLQLSRIIFNMTRTRSSLKFYLESGIKFSTGSKEIFTTLAFSNS